MPVKDIVFGIVGRGGDGVISSGDMLVESASSEGLHCYMVTSYGPQIRGGESSCRVRLSDGPIFTEGDYIDVLVLFNWSDYRMFQTELSVKPDCLILYEENDKTKEEDYPVRSSKSSRMIPVPFAALSMEATGGTLNKNMVMLGVVSSLFGISSDGLEKGIRNKFGEKGAGVLEKNLNAFLAGKKYGEKQKNDETNLFYLTYLPSAPNMVLTGNEATALGAIHAGCRFYAGYPITPSSEILEFMSCQLPAFGGTFIQAEDEMAAIGMVIGASFGGVKAMTATSGPGFSLMTEMLGLASMMEIPVVIVDVQRTGPSTGIPTKSEQSDLWQALYGTHGDAPRVVIAPADVEDCFYTIVDAFNIAEEYQIPVIVLSDQHVGQRRVTVPHLPLDIEVKTRLMPKDADFIEGYKRYAVTENGISPMSVPGDKKGIYQTTGLEHNEKGEPTSTFEIHEAMNGKRYRKFGGIKKEFHYVRRYGPEDAEVGILAWGSCKGAVKEAVYIANANGKRVAAFVPQVLYPFPKKDLDGFLKHIKKLIIIELSYSGQFRKYLNTFLELPKGTVLKKRSGAAPLKVEEVLKAIEEEY